MKTITFTTESLITAVLKADDEQKAQIFNILTGADANSKPQDKLLTKKEACEVLRCSPATIERYVQSGKLTKNQIDGKHSKILFKQSELQTLIDSSKVLTPEAIA